MPCTAPCVLLAAAACSKKKKECVLKFLRGVPGRLKVAKGGALQDAFKKPLSLSLSLFSLCVLSSARFDYWGKSGVRGEQSARECSVQRCWCPAAAAAAAVFSREGGPQRNYKYGWVGAWWWRRRRRQGACRVVVGGTSCVCVFVVLWGGRPASVCLCAWGHKRGCRTCRDVIEFFWGGVGHYNTTSSSRLSLLAPRVRPVADRVRARE